MAQQIGYLEALLGLNSSSFTSGLTSAEKAFQETAMGMARSGGQLSQHIETQLESMSKAAERAEGYLHKAFEFAGGMAIAGVAMAGARSIAAFAEESVMGAARSEQMDKVLIMMGKNAGISSEQIEFQTNAIRGLGIELGTAQNTLQNFIRYQLDATQASKLARVAQNAAVMENTNSSEALDRLIWGIQTQNTEIFRTAGLMINVGGALDNYARSVNKSTSQLTSNERAQAVLNAVLKEGTKIQGAYEESLGSPMKLMHSMERVVNDIQENIGQALLPAFTSLVKDGLEPMLMSFRTATSQGGSLTGFFQAVGAVVTAVAKAITGILPLLMNTFTGLATVVSPVLKIFGAFLGMVGKNQAAITALAVVIGMLVLRQKALKLAMSESSEGMGFIQRALQDYGVGVSSGMKRTEMFGSAIGSMKATAVKAFDSIKAAGLQMLEMLPELLIITAVVSAFSAWNKSQEEAKKKAEDLSKAIKDEITNLTALGNLSTGLKTQGVEALTAAVFSADDAGKKLKEGMIAVGMDTNHASESMKQLLTNTKAYAAQLAITQGLSKKEAEIVGDYVKLQKDIREHKTTGNTLDDKKIRDAYVALSAGAQSYAAQLSSVMAQTRSVNMMNTVKEMMKQAAATDFNATSAKNWALTEMEKNKVQYEGLSQTEKAYKLYALFTNKYYELANSTEVAAKATKDYKQRIEELIPSLAEGQITAEAFMGTLLTGSNNQNKIQRLYFNTSKELGTLSAETKKAHGNHVLLTTAGYKLQDMIATTGAAILNYGGNASDAAYATKQMLDSFVLAALGAKATKAQIEALLGPLNLLDAYTSTHKAGATAGKAYEDILKEIRDSSNSASKAVSALQQAFDKQLTDTLDKATSHYDDLVKASEDFRHTISSSIVSVYSFSNALNAMQTAQKNYDNAVSDVAKAEDDVNKALQNRDMQGYLSALNALGVAQNKLADADKNRLTYMQALQQQYQKAKDFEVVINRLRAAKLNEEGLRQIVAMGAEQGTIAGNELLNAGADAIKQANTWYDSLKESAKATAKAAQTEYYDAGVAIAKSLMDGISKTVSKFKIKLEGKSLSDAQIKQFQKEFKIQTSFSMSAIANNESAVALASGGIVKARAGGTLALLGEAGRNEAVIPLNGNTLPVSGGSNKTYQIHVHTGVGDPVEIGREIVRHLQAYEKRSGSIPIKVK